MARKSDCCLVGYPGAEDMLESMVRRLEFLRDQVEGMSKALDEIKEEIKKLETFIHENAPSLPT